MSNEENSIQQKPQTDDLKASCKAEASGEGFAADVAEESTVVDSPAEFTEEFALTETADTDLPEELPEAAPAVEETDALASLRQHNAAVAYLRKQDCEMLTTLRDHLGENIRLHNILNRIKAESARLRKLLKTPKPKFKTALLIIGLVLIAVGALISGIGSSGEMDKQIDMTALLALGGIGAALIIIAIVLKVLADKKWQAFIDETNEQLRINEEKEKQAQQDIDDYWANHALPFIASIIPDRFPVAHVLEYNTVCGMLYVMDNLRADTIKEAINLYDELCYRSSMRASFQNMESSLYETARNSARYAAAAERSAAANERAAASAALTAASAASMASSVARASSASVDASNAVRDMANRS